MVLILPGAEHGGGEQGFGDGLHWVEAGQGGDGRGGDEMLTLLLGCWKTNSIMGRRWDVVSITWLEKVSEEMYMEEQFGLPEGLSVMDVITRYKQAAS